MKKLLSIILAAAMILSLIPSVFAGEGEAETTTYVYNFELDKNDPRRVKPITNETYFAKYKTEYPADETATWITANTDNWKYFAMSSGLAAVEQAYDVAGIGADGLQMRANKAVDVSEGSQWLAIKIRIPNPGIYNISYTIITNASSYCDSGFISFLPGDYAPEELTYDICKAEDNGIVVGEIDYKITGAAKTPQTIKIKDNVLASTEDNQEVIFVIGNNDMNKGYMVINNLTLTKIADPVDENTYETETNVDVDPSVKVAAYANGATLSQTETTAAKNSDGNGTWDIKTPAEIDGYTFRYWARGLESGNKRIVSLENNFTYSPEKGDANWLIAVYAKDSEEAETEYFNANGQLIPNATDETKPYMLGYGYATDWKNNGNGIKEAVYENGVQSYQITINGETSNYEYGTKITCPTITVPAGKYFWGWKKTAYGSEKAELVSTDMNYTFYAWENCTVEPLFGNSKALYGSDLHKIILSSLDIGNGESVIKAEFIGFEDAVERGITLDKDYAMTNNAATQFAIIKDVTAANISAYAILADGTKFIYNLK